MNIFDYYIYLPFVRFHLWTASVLLIQLLFVFHMKRKYGIWGLVFATLSVTFSIHFYETAHGLSEYYLMGYVGQSLWFFNIPVLFLMSVLMYYWNTSHKIMTKDLKRSFIILCGFIMNMYWLISTGFFPDYDYNLAWGTSKLMASFFTRSLLMRNKNAV